jgi:hypothetical protein
MTLFNKKVKIINNKYNKQNMPKGYRGIFKVCCPGAVDHGCMSDNDRAVHIVLIDDVELALDTIEEAYNAAIV